MREHDILVKRNQTSETLPNPFFIRYNFVQSIVSKSEYILYSRTRDDAQEQKVSRFLRRVVHNSVDHKLNDIYSQ